MTKISIDPITRLEGHGRIDIFLDDAGDVANAYFVVPELRGFEKFCEGRPVEEMPRLTNRICGVCPTAHHVCAAKAADAVYHVTPPPAGRKIRELEYAAFCCADHATHIFVLAGPDFIVGPEAPAAERNILGIIHKVGLELGGRVLQHLKESHEVVGILGGRYIHPVNCVPGGVSKALTPEDHDQIEKLCVSMVEFGQVAIKIFDDIVLGNQQYVDMIRSDAYTHQTYYMGLVDEHNHVNFYDGQVRVVGPDGREFARYAPADYLDHVAETVTPWSYMKVPYLKKIGWKGFVDGPESGVYRATPLSRLNVADGLTTPLAQEQYERYVEAMGGKPVHSTLATHWARLIEMVYTAERALELIRDPEIMDPNVRTMPTEKPTEGIGTVEAPRGTLTHHYVTDERGLLRKVNMIVGTTNNHAAMSMSVKKAAQSLIKGGHVTPGLLNRVEMAFRAYDPCLGCATHTLPGQMPLQVTIRDAEGEPVQVLERDAAGREGRYA